MKHRVVISESQYEELLDILNEQIKPQKQRAGSYGFTVPDLKVVQNTKRTEKSKIDTKSGVGTTNIPENEWDSYIASNEGKLIKFFNKKNTPSYLKNWNAVKQSDKKFAVSYLETFLSNDWDTVTLTKKNEKITVPAEPPKSGDTFPGVQVYLPTPGEPSADFFQDNEWVLTKTFTDMFSQRVINTINIGKEDILSRMPNAQGQTLVYLKDLTINTSCSTLPNGIPQTSPNADKYTSGISFVQLSTERNNATREYVLNLLKQNGVLIDDSTKIIQNPNGTNTGVLLGTSGPAWDSSLPIQQKRQLAPSYDQYKKTEVLITLVFNNKTEPDPIPVKTEPKVITNQYYNGTFYKETGHGGLTIPGFRLSIPKYKWSIVKNFNKCGALSKNPLKRIFKKKPWWEDKKLYYK